MTAAAFAYIRAAECGHLTLFARQKFMNENGALTN